MNTDEILSKVQSIINDVTDIEIDEIVPDAAIMDELSLSSMEVLSVMGKIEDTMGIKVPEKALRTIVTVDNLVEYLAAHN